MKQEFKNQTVLITGATGDIGAQLVNDFSAAGAKLILVGTKENAVNIPGVTYYAVDFLNPHSFNSFLKKLATHKRIDVCINNAGLNVTSSVEDALEKDWDAIMGVNLKAPFRITQVVAQIMKKQKYGRIVNIASIWSVISKPHKSLYTASKFGLRGLTVAASIDLAPYGILVNAVSPGVIETDMSKRMMGPQGMKDMAARVPLGRLGTTKEVSKAVQFLASEENTYITGQNIVVDGGFVNV